MKNKRNKREKNLSHKKLIVEKNINDFKKPICHANSFKIEKNKCIKNLINECKDFGYKSCVTNKRCALDKT